MYDSLMENRTFDHDSIFDLCSGPWAYDVMSGLWVTLSGGIASPGFLVHRERLRWYPPRWIPETKHPNGYIYARFKPKNFLWHRVIASAWIPNPEGKPQVNHIDHDPHNNSINNLEWVTNAENTKHSWKAGRHPQPKHNHLGQFVWT